MFQRTHTFGESPYTGQEKGKKGGKGPRGDTPRGKRPRGQAEAGGKRIRGGDPATSAVSCKTHLGKR